MDKLAKNRQLIKKILTEQADLANRFPSPDVETVTVFDDEHDEYLIRRLGWNQHRRVRTTVLHVRIRDGKFWIEEDWTEEGLATSLLEAGIPNEEIVLGFQPPEMRPYTEFAVA